MRRILSRARSAQRDGGVHGRTGARRALDAQAAAERLDAVAEAAQAAASLRTGAADAVVGDRERRGVERALDADLDLAAIGVLGDVGERFRGDEVERDLLRL